LTAAAVWNNTLQLTCNWIKHKFYITIAICG
jgi:hypothetical protein